MKFKIHYLTYCYVILALLSGLFKNVLALIIVIICHEIGHIIIIKLLKYPITKITIYPFFGIIKINKLINTKISHDLLITIGGFMGQIILFLIMSLFKDSYLNFLIIKYNKLFFILNLLILYPFDGYFLINHLLTYLFSYQKSIKIMLLINYFNILGVIAFMIIYNYYNYPLIIMAFIGLIISNNYQKEALTKFYLERLYEPYYYRKIKYLKRMNKNLIKREIKPFYCKHNKVYTEKVIILKKAL